MSFKTLLADEQVAALHMMGVQHWAGVEPKVVPPLLVWVAAGHVTAKHVGAQHLLAAVMRDLETVTVIAGIIHETGVGERYEVPVRLPCW